MTPPTDSPETPGCDRASALPDDEAVLLLAGVDHWRTCSNPAHGIPSLLLCDGPHGLRKQEGAADSLGIHESVPATCFPAACTLACSFDVDMAREVGRAIGAEAAEQGVAVVLGPGLNVKRSPLGGRNFEYFSEDPLLSGAMAAAMVRGVQSRGVGACVKHLACNNQETARQISDSIVDARALREIYLRGFEIAVREGEPWAVMTAYNLLNGEYCSENEALLTSILRGEWGFRGACVTDWGAMSDSVATVAAGCDLVMPGPRPDHADAVLAALADGSLARGAFDAAVARTVALARRWEAEAAARTAAAEGANPLDVARRAAEASIVLLENDGLLPLAPTASVALIGAFAAHPRYQGAGSSKINPVALDNLHDALRAAGADVRFAEGYDLRTGETDDGLLGEAARAAAAADVAIVVAGLPDRFESEGFDRPDMRLPRGHAALIERVCAANGHTVVVLQCGSPVELPWNASPAPQEADARPERQDGGSEARADGLPPASEQNAEASRAAPPPAAVLLAGLSGCQGGAALANVLLGFANPSGKLAETWPMTLDDTALGSSFPAQGRQALYRESVYVGYRYFDAAAIKPAYPFGHGLSYASFALSNAQARCENGRWAVDVDVRNGGRVDGAEVVQAYVHALDPVTFAPPQALAGFAKVRLRAGETRRVRIGLDSRSFSYWNAERSAWDALASDFEVRLGVSSRDIRLTVRVRPDADMQAESDGKPNSPSPSPDVPATDGRQDADARAPRTPNADTAETRTASRSVDERPLQTPPDDVPACYRTVTRNGFDDDSFARLLGRPVPPARPLRPIDLNSTVADIDRTLLGHVALALIGRWARKASGTGGGGTTKAVLDAMAADMPLRALIAGGASMTLVQAAVCLLNNRFVAGGRLLAQELRRLKAQR